MKEYQKPEIEIISLSMQEPITDDTLIGDDDVVMGVESSFFD